MPKHHQWTKDELEWLKINAPIYPTRYELADEFNKLYGHNFKYYTIFGAMERNGIRTGRDGRFVVGGSSHNKGKKQSDFIPPEKMENVKKHWFKAGWGRPVGDVFIRHRTRTGKTMMIKTGTKGKQEMLYARYLMEKKIGRELTRDDVVIHLDGNRLNCDIDNLMLLTWGELVELTHNDGYIVTDDPNINLANILNIKIERAIREHDLRRSDKANKEKE